MFVRKWQNMPQDPACTFTADLEMLGLSIDKQGRISDRQTGKLFQYYASSNERSNEVRKEAVHEAVRQEIKEQLAIYGVQQVYLTGPDGIYVKEEKPKTEGDNRHVPILVSDPAALREKRDVIIVIGEHNQDMGVFAYRELFGEAGIRGGSVLGLTEKLQKVKLGGRSKENGKVQFDKLDEASARRDSVTIVDDVPGIIIPNPGQLNYSPAMNRAMGMNAWLARPKKDALQDNITVDPTWNRVPGHTNERQHVKTCFDNVIPELVGPKANLYVVAISDGADNFISWMDAWFAAGMKNIFGSKTLKALAFIGATTGPEELQSDGCKRLLYAHGKNWILHESPLGTVLGVPEVMPAPKQDSGEDVEEAADDKENMKPSFTTETEQGPFQRVDFSKGRARGPSELSTLSEALAEDKKLKNTPPSTIKPGRGRGHSIETNLEDAKNAALTPAKVNKPTTLSARLQMESLNPCATTASSSFASLSKVSLASDESKRRKTREFQEMSTTDVRYMDQYGMSGFASPADKLSRKPSFDASSQALASTSDLMPLPLLVPGAKLSKEALSEALKSFSNTDTNVGESRAVSEDAEEFLGARDPEGDFADIKGGVWMKPLKPLPLAALKTAQGQKAAGEDEEDGGVKVEPSEARQEIDMAGVNAAITTWLDQSTDREAEMGEVGDAREEVQAGTDGEASDKTDIDDTEANDETEMEADEANEETKMEDVEVKMGALMAEKSEETLVEPTNDEGRDNNDLDDEYLAGDVAMLTVSSGVADVTERILPAVMGDVLAWFGETMR